MKNAILIIGSILWIVIFLILLLLGPNAKLIACLWILIPGICLALSIAKKSNNEKLNAKINELEKRIEELEKGR